MSKPKELKRGDKCPADGGELKPAYVPSDDEWKKAFDRENPIALPPRADTASPEQRKELGELFRCNSCGYTTRFPAEQKADKKSGDQPAA